MAIGAEEHGADVRNHHGAHGIEAAAASAANHEHRTVHELPAQFGEAFLPPSLALLLGSTDLGAAVSGGGRRRVGGWLNGERGRQERPEIVGAADPLTPAGRPRVEQEAIRGTSPVRERANEAVVSLATGKYFDRTA